MRQTLADPPRTLADLVAQIEIWSDLDPVARNGLASRIRTCGLVVTISDIRAAGLYGQRPS